MTVPVDLVRHVEDLGYHSVWTAEAYGTDALSPLAYLAAVTTRIKLGTGVTQIAARSPAATAMHAATIDALAGGDRVIIGLGVSGPQIVEGWYGQAWGNPERSSCATTWRSCARCSGEEPLTNEGTEYPVALRRARALGQGKPLRSILHPNPNIPIWLAAGGPLNTALAAEVADGLLPMGWGADGTARSTGRASTRGSPGAVAPNPAFEVFGGVEVVITDDVAGALAGMKPLTAMYVGGMGSATHNYHREAMARRGFPEAAARIHELWLAGRRDEAIAAVPDEYHDDGGLIGSIERIRSRWEPWTRRGFTGLTVRANAPEGFDLLADLAGTRDGASS